LSLITTLKRFGITTGGAAAAASKASVIYLVRGENPKSVTIPTPIGLRIEVPVDKYERRDDKYCAAVRKFAGDNPDVLDGLEIVSCSKRSLSFAIKGGEGIGVITRPGLRGEIGSKSISPTAMEMIKAAVKEVTDENVEVEISVPNGRTIARNTMNPSIGIVDGISILGTTGIEYPVSDEDYMDHLRTEICVIKHSGSKSLVIAPGNVSFEVAKRMFGDIAVKIGDRVGDTIKLAEEMGFEKVTLISLPGKLVKVAAGIMNTHNKYGDARVETITYASVLADIEVEKIRKIANSLTVSEALTYLDKEERVKVMKVVAERALKRLKSITSMSVEVIALSEEGEVLARAGQP